MTTTPTRGDRILLGHVIAGMELLGRSGVRNVELAFDDDGPVLWWCGGNWNGTRAYSERFPYPAHAVDNLLSRVINGGQCRRCSRTTVIGVDVEGLCCFQLHAGDVDDEQTYRWMRSCEREAHRG